MKKIVYALCGVVMLLVGCQNTINTIEPADKSAQPTYVRDARFVTDAALQRRLALTGINTAVTPSGCLKFQIQAINVRTGVWAQALSGMTGENPYRVLYKVDWFDQNGMNVPGVLSDWKSLTIIPGETVYIRGIAPTEKCKDFKVSLKEAE